MQEGKDSLISFEQFKGLVCELDHLSTAEQEEEFRQAGQTAALGLSILGLGAIARRVIFRI